MVSTLLRDPQARSSALAALGTLQPRAFGSLNRIETLDSASNYYIETNSIHKGYNFSARLSFFSWSCLTPKTIRQGISNPPCGRS